MKKKTVLLSFEKKNAEINTNESLHVDGNDVYTEVLIISDSIDRLFVKSSDLKPLQEIFTWIYSNKIAGLQTEIQTLQNSIRCDRCNNVKKWWQFWK